MAACDRVDSPPAVARASAVIVDPERDSTWTSVGSFALLGCALAVTDPVAMQLRVLDSGATRWRTIGRAGRGPGELRHPLAIAAQPDSTLVVMDWVRRRLIRYRLDGKLLADVPLRGGVSHHAHIGRIALAPDGRIVDYWMALAQTILIPKADFDTLPLVSALDAAGHPLPGGWGRPQPPRTPDAALLRSVLQRGDLATRGDTLYVLRSMEASVEVYSLSTPTRLPLRKIWLRRYRRTPKPTETMPATAGPEGFMARGRVVAEPQALALTVDRAGRVYVASPLNTRITPQMPWPAEGLTVYSPAGAVVESFRLPGRDTRQIAIARDGSLLVRGRPDSATTSTTTLQVFEPLFGQPPRCEFGRRGTPERMPERRSIERGRPPAMPSTHR